MSLIQFSDTTNKQGIVQAIRRRTGTNTASGGSYPIEDITLDVNMALSNFLIIANEAAGKNQPVDDTNHIDYPVIYADVFSGEQDVVITLDANGNQIQNIYKVILTKLDGTKQVLRQIDITDTDDSFLLDSTSGIPETFDLSANGIFLHQKPNFSLVGALEIWTSRGGSYFTAADTTKKPGIPERFGEYLILRPSYFYCLEKGKEQAGAYREALYGRDGRGGMEAQIRAFYAKRDKVDEMVITSEPVYSI
jgi:hypothetical protein